MTLRRSPFIIGSFCLVMGLTLILSGCGSNIFDPFIDDPKEDSSITSLNDQLDNASSQSDFITIRQRSQSVLDNPESSPSDQNEARLIQSQAIMGQYNVTSLDIFSDLVDISEGSDDNAVLFDLIQTRVANNDMPSSDVRLAANLTNTANSNGATLSTTDQLNRALVNVVSVINIAETVYDISSDTVTARNDSQTASQRLEILMNPDGDDETNDSISYYATQASNALTLSNTLNSDKEAELNNVIAIADDISTLHQIVNNGSSGSFSYNGGVITSESSDDAINAAIEDIFTKSR